MKNARRILSLVLSFLMVFGSVATLLPTTVMAEDEGISITFQDANGVQIGNPVPLGNATTIKELLASGAAANVKAAITQTADKVFAGWTLTNGTAVDDTAAVTENLTVKATFSNYKVYTAEDLAAEKVAGRLEKGRLLISDTTTTYNVGDVSRTFLHITPDANNSSYYKRAQKFAWSLGYELTGYSVMAINHITNARHNDLEKSSYITPSNGSVTYYVNPSTDLEDKGGYTDGTEEILAKYPITDGAKKFDIVPWGAADFRLPTDAEKGGIAPEDYTKTYVDIEYIAFFEKAGAENYFDYNAYLNPAKYVTFIGEGGTELAVVQIDEKNNTIKKILASNADGVADVKAAIAQTKTKVFAGWTLADGTTAVDADAVIDGSITVKPSFSKYRAFTASELIGMYNSGAFVISGLTASLSDADRSFLHLQSTATGSHKMVITFNEVLSDYSAVAIRHITNHHYNDKQTMFIQTVSDVSLKIDNATVNYFTRTPVNIQNGGEDEINAVFALNEDVAVLKFAPWRGRGFADGTGAGTIDANSVYADIEYIAFFEKKSGAQYFDCKAYLELPEIVYFENTAGEVIETLEVGEDGTITLIGFEETLEENELFIGWKAKGADNSTAIEAGGKVAITGITTFVPVVSKRVTLTVNDIGDTDKVIEALTDFSIPLDKLVSQYKDTVTGEYMVISGWKVGENTYAADEYVVNEYDTAIEVIYAPAYILSAADGTLEDGTSRDVSSVNAPVNVNENGISFKHITSVNGATTVAGSQVQFLLTEEGNDINKNAGKITYENTPYVSYLYRTNIDLSSSSNTIKSAFSVNKFAHNDGYTGTAEFGQVIENVEFDEKWQILVHKAESFGTITKDAVFAGYLDGVRVSPWSNEADITLDGTEYADIQYIGFFPSETAAKNFNYSKYLEQNALEVTVTIDGEVNTELSGNYMPGAVINFPDVIGQGLAGYVLADGTVAMSVTVPEDNDGDGKIEITVTSREVNVDEYIQYRGNLGNLKNAGNDITVVYIGGSVTDGRGASAKANRWTGLTTQYLKTKFANVTEYEEALGGHGSRSAAYRLAGDVLSHNPDIVFIEFAINDTYNDDVVNGVYDGKYYEYVVREIRKKLPNTEIVTVYVSNNTVIKDKSGKLIDGKHFVAKMQDVIADAYDIPSIDVGKYAFEAMFGEDGTYSEDIWLKYYVDDVHPGDGGYALYARAIREYLETALNEATSDASPETMLDEADVLYPKSLTFMPAVLGWDELEITGLVPADVKQSTTINKYYKYDPDYTGDRTVSFTFEGTELGIYIALPTDDENTEIGGAGNTSATGTVTVTIDGVKHTKAPGRKGPYMYGQNLENKKHEVTITISNVNNDSCKLYGIFVGQEKKTYTIDLSASAGGQVEYNGETAAKHTISAYEGQVLTFTAVPSAEENTKLRNWHDLTSGHIVVLTDKDGVPYEDDNAPETIKYTVKGNAIISANFVHASLRTRVRLIAMLGFREDKGYFTVKGYDTNPQKFEEYMYGDSTVELTAVAHKGYTPAYWKRLSPDTLTEVLLVTCDTVEAYPLGSSVYYQPVFTEEGTPVEIYINKATREIITDTTGYETEINTALSTDAVTVYDCTKKVEANDGNLLVVRDKNGNIVKKAQKPAYASEWVITTDNDGMKWTMSIGGGEAFDVSYDKEFRFNYMFNDGTKVVITETPVTGSENTDYVIKTLASWSANKIANFTGVFELGNGIELVQHGIMMSQSADDLGDNKLVSNETGTIQVAEGTIVGKVNAANPTSLYTVSKRLANDADVWYGRAYLIYKKNGITYLVYADEVVSAVPAV